MEAWTHLPRICSGKLGRSTVDLKQPSSEGRDRAPQMFDERFAARRGLADGISNLELHRIQAVGVGAAVGLRGEAAVNLRGLWNALSRRGNDVAGGLQQTSQTAPAKYREWIVRKQAANGIAVIRADVDIRRVGFNGRSSVDVEEESPAPIVRLDFIDELPNGLMIFGVKRARGRRLRSIERALLGTVRIDELPMIVGDHHVGRLAKSLEKQLSDGGGDLSGKSVAKYFVRRAPWS